MAVISDHIYYVGTSAYDLRKVSSVVADFDNVLNVLVRFIDEPRTTVTFVKIGFEAAWQLSLNASGSAAPAGPASGDLGGVYPGPDVVGIQGTPVAATAPSAGNSLVYNSTTAQWEPTSPTRFFLSSAAAVAAAALTPFINSTVVVISPGTPTSEAGTYTVNSNGGIAFPGDYVKVSDVSDTAAEVSVVDAGGFYGSTDVEGVLQELGPALNSSIQLSGALPDATTTAMDTVAVAAPAVAPYYGAAHWEVELVNGTSRYKSTVDAATDGATAEGIESNVVIGPGLLVTPFTIDVDVVAGNMRLTAALTSPGWSFRVRRLLLTA